MKRCLMLLMLILVFFRPVRADLSPYRCGSQEAFPAVEGLYRRQLFPLSGGRVWQFEEGNTLCRSLILQGQELLLTFELPKNGASFEPMIRGNGQMALFQGGAEKGIILIDDAARTSRLLPLDHAIFSVLPLGDQFAAIWEMDEFSYLFLFDDRMERSFLYPLWPGSAGLHACLLTSDGAFAALIYRPSEGDHDTALCLCKFSADGQMLWLSELPDEWETTGLNLVETSAGNLIVYCTDRTDYKSARLFCFDAQGNACWNRLLSEKNRVLGLYTAVPDAQGVLFYGRSVARSQGVFKAFCAAVSEEGALTRTEAKDFSEPQDYDFSILASPPNEMFVYLPDSQASLPQLLVPFDALPEAPAPVLTLQ